MMLTPKDLRIGDEVVIDRDLDSEARAEVLRIGTDRIWLLIHDSGCAEEWLDCAFGRFHLACAACDDDASVGGRVLGRAFCVECIGHEERALRRLLCDRVDLDCPAWICEALEILDGKELGAPSARLRSGAARDAALVALLDDCDIDPVTLKERQ